MVPAVASLRAVALEENAIAADHRPDAAAAGVLDHLGKVADVAVAAAGGVAGRGARLFRLQTRFLSHSLQFLDIPLDDLLESPGVERVAIVPATSRFLLTSSRASTRSSSYILSMIGFGCVGSS